jgi:hypothetical protein
MMLIHRGTSRVHRDHDSYSLLALKLLSYEEHQGQVLSIHQSRMHVYPSPTMGSLSDLGPRKKSPLREDIIMQVRDEELKGMLGQEGILLMASLEYDFEDENGHTKPSAKHGSPMLNKKQSKRQRKIAKVKASSKVGSNENLPVMASEQWREKLALVQIEVAERQRELRRERDQQPDRKRKRQP